MYIYIYIFKYIYIYICLLRVYTGGAITHVGVIGSEKSRKTSSLMVYHRLLEKRGNFEGSTPLSDTAI